MKRTTSIILAILLASTLVGCGSKNNNPEEELCPGKQPGVADKEPTPAAGFDTTVNMDFSSMDTRGKKVTNEIFAGTDKGAWLLFWRTDNDKSMDELKKLNEMIPTAEKNGYKIIGIVMDGDKNPEKAKEMTENIGFTNILWNNEVEKIYGDVLPFFTKEFHEENKNNFTNLPTTPKAGDPVSTATNSRGQIQTSCNLVPLVKEQIEDYWIKNNGNDTYEELTSK